MSMKVFWKKYIRVTKSEIEKKNLVMYTSYKTHIKSQIRLDIQSRKTKNNNIRIFSYKTKNISTLISAR